MALNKFEAFDVSFYSNLEDASLEENPLPQTYESSNPQIYARLENNNECENVVNINLVVNPAQSGTAYRIQTS